MLLGCAPATSSDGGADAEPGLEATSGVDLPESAGLSPAGISINGISINGISINGISINGISINGPQINNVTLQKVALAGAMLSETGFSNVTLSEVELEASIFSGKKPDGTNLSGDEMLGVSFWGELANGTRRRLRIESRSELSSPGGDVSAYDVTYASSEGRKHLCGLDAEGEPVLAIPINGAWNYEQGFPGASGFVPAPAHFTFACRGAAIAKCVELGYQPWESAPNGSGDRTDYLVACTRAIRADYCGDGTPHTVNGTNINLYDDIGVQGDGAAWGFEAEWTAAGARFVRPGPGAARYGLAGGAPPSCIAQLESASAGDLAHFDNGTLLMTEFSLP
jgi:uncharacterized protein YjbI with pentapeptide repeats